MQGKGLSLRIRISPGESSEPAFVPGGLFLDDARPSCFARNVLFHGRSGGGNPVLRCRGKGVGFGVGLARERKGFGRELGFLSVSLSAKRSEGIDGCSVGSAEVLGESGEKESVDTAEEEVEVKKVKKVVKGSSGAMNMTKHLWAGAVAAMVSRFYFLGLARVLS